MPRLALPLIFVALAGCASTVAKIFPVGEPVTAERCQALDMKALGYKDGNEGQRPGPRFEFWDKDCRAFGVKISREKYDEGYTEGLGFYCSCEKGFQAGVKDEFTETRGQYYVCKRVQFAEFLRGHALGQPLKADPAYVTVKGVHSIYDEAAIAKAGVQTCHQ